MVSEKPMFSELPKIVVMSIHLVSGLLGPYIFCYLAGLQLPDSLGSAALDIVYMYLTLFIFIPYFLIVVPLLKLFFYGSIKDPRKGVCLEIVVVEAVKLPLAVFNYIGTQRDVIRKSSNLSLDVT